MFLDFLIFLYNLSGFSILLNHMSSQGVFSKDIYHGTVMIYDTKTMSCTIRAIHITQGQLESPEKQNAAQLTIMQKKKKNTVKLLHYHTHAMCSYFKNIPYSPISLNRKFFNFIVMLDHSFGLNVFK